MINELDTIIESVKNFSNYKERINNSRKLLLEFLSNLDELAKNLDTFALKDQENLLSLLENLKTVLSNNSEALSFLMIFMQDKSKKNKSSDKNKKNLTFDEVPAVDSKV